MWDSLIYQELAEGRPVLFGAESKECGHAFVCDGYDGNGLYHINWGWDGDYDGYFRLDILSPKDEGETEYYTSGDAFSTNQFVVLGMQPKTGVNPATKDSLIVPTVTCMHSERSVYTRTSSTENFNVRVKTYLRNNCQGTYNFGVKYVLASADGTYSKELLSSGFGTGTVGRNEPNSQFLWTYKTIGIGSDLADGTYTLKVIGNKRRETVWHPCPNSDIIYLQFDIKGDTLKVTTYGNADYRVDSVALDRPAVVGFDVDLAATITNTGTFTTYNTADYQATPTVVLCVDGESIVDATSSLGTFLEGGATDVLHFVFPATTEGTHTYVIGYHGYQSTSIDTLYTGTFEVLSSLPLTFGQELQYVDETTGITQTHQTATDDCWFTLGGARLANRPTRPGIYLNRGRKVIIK
jgi:hypothetical protein